MRTVWAFCLTPVFVALLAACLLPFVAFFAPAHGVTGFVASLFLSPWLAYPISLFLGMPAHFVLRYLHTQTWTAYMFAGAVCGVLGMLLLNLLFHYQGANSVQLSFESAQVLGLCAFNGAVYGLMFWLLAIPSSVGPLKRNSHLNRLRKPCRE